MKGFEFFVSFTSIILISAFIIVRDKGKTKRFLDLIQGPMFSVNMLFVIIFSIYMLNSDDNTKEKKRRAAATKAAILGLLIAFMAHLEMKIASFWLIWCASYYLNAE